MLVHADGPAAHLLLHGARRPVARVRDQVHPRFGTPHVTTILTGVVCAVAGALFPIGILGELVSIGTLFAFVLVSMGVMILRRSAPTCRAPSASPAVPYFVPLCGAATSLYIIYEAGRTRSSDSSSGWPSAWSSTPLTGGGTQNCGPRRRRLGTSRRNDGGDVDAAAQHAPRQRRRHLQRRISCTMHAPASSSSRDSAASRPTR